MLLNLVQADQFTVAVSTTGAITIEAACADGKAAEQLSQLLIDLEKSLREALTERMTGLSDPFRAFLAQFDKSRAYWTSVARGNVVTVTGNLDCLGVITLLFE
jgi:hypothetical protein